MDRAHVLDGNHGDWARLHGGYGPGLAKAKAAGIAGVICKATQGQDWRDGTFARIVTAARGAGLVVGAYHFASGSSDGAQQADHFLSTVAPLFTGGSIVLALDWEGNPDRTNGDMTPENARRFVQRIHDRTGVWPLLYSGTSYLGSHLGRAPCPILGQCPLWAAQYGEEPGDSRVQDSWHDWTLWQYTNGGSGPRDQRRYPRKTPGIGGCDRSVFDGDETALCAWWTEHAVHALTL